jgi:hypothetical protein
MSRRAPEHPEQIQEWVVEEEEKVRKMGGKK